MRMCSCKKRLARAHYKTCVTCAARNRAAAAKQRADPAKRARVNERQRERYANDADYREERKANSRARRRADPEVAEREAAREAERERRAALAVPCSHCGKFEALAGRKMCADCAESTRGNNARVRERRATDAEYDESERARQRASEAKRRSDPDKKAEINQGKRERRAVAKVRGKCSECHKRAPMPNGVMCAVCRQYHRDWYHGAMDDPEWRAMRQARERDYRAGRLPKMLQKVTEEIYRGNSAAAMSVARIASIVIDDHDDHGGDHAPVTIPNLPNRQN